MNMLTQIFAGLTALILVVVFVLEVFFHHRKELYSFTLIEPEDVPAVRMWAINTGFYNLTYGLGLLTGLILLHTPWVEAGRALVLFGCAAHVVLGIVLYFSERRLWSSALLQSTPPLIAVLAYLVQG
jgi:putative membrane protein